MTRAPARACARDAPPPSASLGDPDGLGLPKPPGRVRTALQRHPRGVDCALAGLLLCVALASQTSVPLRGAPWDVQAAWGLLSLASTAAAVVRRSVPHLLAALSCLVLLSALPGTFGSVLGASSLVLALHTLAARRPVRATWAWTVAGTAAAAAGAVPAVPETGGPFVGAVLGFGMLFSLATLAGVSAGDRARYTAAILERAAQLARERDQRAQLAAAAERTRIAREMHDIVAHSLTVVVALSEGAAAAAEGDPARAKEVMTHVAEIGRTSLADMRRVLGALLEPPSAEPASRATSAPLAPQPSFAELEPLVRSFLAAGLPVVLTVAGPAPDGAAIQLTLFRVVQEALTNTLRHSLSPSRVEVLLDSSDPAVVEVTVVDDGLRPATGRGASDTVGSHRGLLGMRERVSLHGGSVEAGPLDPRGWRVHASLPLDGSGDTA